MTKLSKSKLPQGVTMEQVEQIQELAEKGVVFGKWSPSLKAALSKFVYSNLQRLDCNADWTSKDDDGLFCGYVYRLNPEYVENLREPESVLEVYEVKPINGLYWVVDPIGNRMYVTRDLQHMEGFAGVQFQNQKYEHIWHNTPFKYIDGNGLINEINTTEQLESGELKPAVPVKVAFFRSEEQ